MSSTKQHIIIFLSSLASVTTLMVLTAIVEPKFFSLVPGTFPPDSTLQHHAVVSDSAGTSGNLPDLMDDSSSSTTRQPDTARVQATPVATNAETKQLPEKTKGNMSGLKGNAPTIVPASVDTLEEAELRKMVQIFESMDPEVAARILMKMDEDAIRKVIARMKSRQSAKILATLEPEQAARILKGKKNS
ncbi:MAG: hypothetical protein KF749_00510 [Bacteroidetes bacterium]|nr:hypothetical protein [Bacteroidota bacterium]MCW5895110.1 hypothetical protein [Bacteroidota bacterium]